MEIIANESLKKQSIRLPQKRGQIKIKIFKKLGKAFMSMIGCFGMKKDGDQWGFAEKDVVPFETTGGFKPGSPIDW